MEIRDFLNQVADVIEKDPTLKDEFEKKINSGDAAYIVNLLENGKDDHESKYILDGILQTNKWFGFFDPPVLPKWRTGKADPMLLFTRRTWEGQSDLFIILEQKLRQMIYAFIHEGSDSPDYYIYCSWFKEGADSDKQVFIQKWYQEYVLGKETGDVGLFGDYRLCWDKDSTWIEDRLTSYSITNYTVPSIQKFFDCIGKNVNVIDNLINSNSGDGDVFEFEASEIHFLSKKLREHLCGRKPIIRKMFRLRHLLNKIEEMNSSEYTIRCQEEFDPNWVRFLHSDEENLEFDKKLCKFIQKKRKKVFDEAAHLLFEDSRFWWD